MILDGKMVRDNILEDLKRQIKENDLKIKLAILLVGDNETSKVYVRNKINACKSVGIECNLLKYPDTLKETELLATIKELNNNNEITGIILQSPVPKSINFDKCVESIMPSKDVDGFTKENIYNLYLGNKTIMPCTVKGIIKLLDYYNISLTGKKVLVIGRGNIVGKPLGLALLNKNAIVTWAHSYTNNLKELTLNADIIISAVGIPKLITSDMVNDNTVIIDVGISVIDNKIIGDADFINLKDKVAYITPTPGGIGPMTVAMIIDNLVEMKSDNKGV